MKKLEEDFLTLLGAAVTGRSVRTEDFAETDWKSILQLCNKNGLAAMMYPVIPKAELPKELKNSWEMLQFQIYVKEQKHYFALMEVLERFNEAKIGYALFKGILLAGLYKEPSYRESSDSDILVDEEDLEKAQGILRELGYEMLPEKSKEKVPVYQNGQTGHVIELHKDLFEDYEGIKIDKLRSFGLSAKEHRRKVTIDEKTVWTLGYEEHLIYLVFHLVKHFVLEGIGIRAALEIGLYLQHYGQEISMESFWKKMEALRYERFCSIVFQISIEHFGLDQKLTEGHRESIREKEMDSLLYDFIHFGDLTDGEALQWKLVYNMKPYLQGEEGENSHSKFGRTIQFLFPSQERIHPDYGYAKKHKWLLPIAWVHRGFRAAKKQIRPEEGEYSSLEKMSAVEKRVALLNSVGLDR